MTQNTVSIEGYVPHPQIVGYAERASITTYTSIHAPLVSQGPPPAGAHAATPDARQSVQSAAESSPCQEKLQELLRYFPWFNLKTINRPELKCYAQLLFDDGYLQANVSDYFRPLQGHESVLQKAFYHGTSSINEGLIREFGLGDCTVFHCTTSEARIHGTCYVSGRLAANAKVGVIENTMQEWDTFNAYCDDIVERFACAAGLPSAQKLYLQKHLQAEILRAQRFDAVLLKNAGENGWRCLFLLASDKIDLEFE